MSKKADKRTKKNTVLEVIITGVMGLIMAAIAYILSALYIGVVVGFIASVVFTFRATMGFSIPVSTLSALLILAITTALLLVSNLIYTRSTTGKWRIAWRSFYRIIADLAVPGV